MADIPASDELGCGRQIFRVALWRTTIGPGDQRFLFLIGEAAIIREGSARLHGMPGRHSAESDSGSNGLSPGPGVIVREQRHGGDVTGTVAAGAVLIQNRRDI